MSVRVLFVLPSFAGGGAERVALSLLAGLDRGRFAAHLLVLDGRGPLAGLVPDHVAVTDLSTPRLSRALPRLIRAIRGLGPDVVFSTLGYVNLALLAARPLLPRGLHIIVREANMPSLALGATPRPALFRAAYRLLYPRAERVVCTSRRMIDEMARDFKVPPAHLALLPNPIDEAAIRAAAATPTREPGPGLRLVAAGRLTRQKGFDRLVDMMAALPPDTHLTILGDGPDGPALAERARLLGVGERVRLVGFCDNPWAFYAGADAFVMPSLWEGMPNAALEALAAGTPVIAAPTAGAMAEIAEAAPDGAVTVAEAGTAMIKAIEALSPSAPITAPRPSLLPEANRAGAVHAAFAQLLAGVA